MKQFTTYDTFEDGHVRTKHVLTKKKGNELQQCGNNHAEKLH
jgi:hypothetical protein